MVCTTLALINADSDAATALGISTADQPNFGLHTLRFSQLYKTNGAATLSLKLFRTEKPMFNKCGRGSLPHTSLTQPPSFSDSADAKTRRTTILLVLVVVLVVEKSTLPPHRPATRTSQRQAAKCPTSMSSVSPRQFLHGPLFKIRYLRKFLVKTYTHRPHPRPLPRRLCREQR